jgi:hypothetical protein
MTITTSNQHCLANSTKLALYTYITCIKKTEKTKALNKNYIFYIIKKVHLLPYLKKNQKKELNLQMPPPSPSSSMTPF